MAERAGFRAFGLAGLLRASRLRDRSVYTSRRRYDSSEILRHLRPFVRRGWPACFRARPGANVEREHDRLGRAPRRRGRWWWLRGPRGVDSGGSSGGSTAAAAVGMWAAEARPAWARPCPRLRRLPSAVVVVRCAPPVERSVVAHAQRRQHRHRDALEAAAVAARTARRRQQHRRADRASSGSRRLCSAAPGGPGVQPSARRSSGHW